MLKRILWILLILINSFTLFGQSNSYNWCFGNMLGSFGLFNNDVSITSFNYNSIKGHKYFDISLNPNFRFKATKSLYIGYELLFLYHKNFNNHEYNNGKFGLSSNIRYYLNQKKLSYFLTTGFGIIYNTLNFQNSESFNNAFIIKSGLGASYFVTKNISIDSELFHKYQSAAIGIVYIHENNIGFNFGFSIFFGGKK